MIYLQLFWSFFQIGLFSIGGGYAAMPIIQNQIVDLHKWMTFAEFTDLITISQMTPGPIAINAATFVGIRICGFGGAIVATLGCILPSCIIVMTLAYFYFKYKNLTVIQGILGGLRPAVVALIASAGLLILITSFWDGNVIPKNPMDINFVSVGIFLVCLFVLRKFKINPIYAMMGAGVVGICVYQFIL